MCWVQLCWYNSWETAAWPAASNFLIFKLHNHVKQKIHWSISFCQKFAFIHFRSLCSSQMSQYNCDWRWKLTSADNSLWNVLINFELRLKLSQYNELSKNNEISLFFKITLLKKSFTKKKAVTFQLHYTVLLQYVHQCYQRSTL